MHPQLHHQSTAKPLDEARYLGFSNMGHHTAPAKPSGVSIEQTTSSRLQDPSEDMKSPTFQFTFHREHSLELSPEAKRLMYEKREEAAKIRKQMIVSSEARREGGGIARRIATPKSQKNRFSDVHAAEFKKMDSIAGHASAFRADRKRVKDTTEPSSMAKSLKRSPSKARLDEQSNPQSSCSRSLSKANITVDASWPPAAKLASNVETSSPAKRMKCAVTEGISFVSAASADGSIEPSSTQQANVIRVHSSYPNLSQITTPTKASLARATSAQLMKATKIPAPALAHSPSKYRLAEDKILDGPSVPLLARSPSKGALFSSETQPQRNKTVPNSPLLARTPLKRSPQKLLAESSEVGPSQPPEVPLLSRSPFKMSVVKSAETEAGTERQPSIPLLARSPSKIAPPNIMAEKETPQTPGKPCGEGFMGRFSLLRSPMKSILRSPQRLYSDDPAKVAAGTHLATPPKYSKASASRLLELPSARKRVDFSSSTKARHEAAESSSRSTTPSKVQERVASLADAISTTPTGDPALPFGYPELPSNVRFASPSPQKRRETIAPADFTFAASNQPIVFGCFPKAAVDAPPKTKRVSTIRHVSAEPDESSESNPAPPAQGRKKRKFEFENDSTVHPVDARRQELPTAGGPPTIQGSKKRKFEFENEIVTRPHGVEDKENTGTENGDEDERPTKRARSNPPEHVASSSIKKRLPTLGVKPKGAKSSVQDSKAGKLARPNTISRARINALAQPKKRG